MIKYGKYKGRTVGEVVLGDPRYALWAHKNVWWFNLTEAQIKYAVIEYEKILEQKNRQYNSFEDFMDSDIPF